MMFEKFAMNSPIAERITQCAGKYAAHSFYILTVTPQWTATLLAFIEGTKQFAASLVAQAISFRIQMAATHNAGSRI